MLCFSTFLFNWQSIIKAPERPSGSVFINCTSLANPVMVPHTAETGCQEAHPFASTEEVALPGGQSINTSSGSETALGRMDIIIKCLQTRGLSEKAPQLICSSWSKGTAKQYNPVWTKWRCWCDKEHINPLRPSPEQLANFLTLEFYENKSYSTLNMYRSAISSTVHLLQGNKIGEHPVISRCLKGIYLSRPPIAKYQSTWDVSVVTSYLSTCSPVEKLSLKMVTLKTVMLCSLVCAQRSQTLCLLDLNHKTDLQESMKFVISYCHKTSKPGKKLEVFFPTLPDNVDLCPKSTLVEYLWRTEPLRNRNGKYSSKVFLSFVKPHKEGTTATIARWIKEVLKLSGKNTNIFKAHSIPGGINICVQLQ